MQADENVNQPTFRGNHWPISGSYNLWEIFIGLD
jgi:hypothetical protein